MDRRAERRLTGDGDTEQKDSDSLAAEIGPKGITAIRSGINRRSSIRLDEHNLHAGYERVCGRIRSMSLAPDATAGGFFFFPVSAAFRENNCPPGINLGYPRLIYNYIYYIYIYIHGLLNSGAPREGPFISSPSPVATLRTCIFFRFSLQPPRLGL